MRTPIDYSTADYYKFYKKNYTKGPILDFKTFRSILFQYNKLCSEEILKGRVVRITGIGNLYVRKNKRFKEDFKDLPINWRATNKMWLEKPELKGVKYVRYTDMFVYRIYLDIKESKTKYTNRYKFQAVRDVNRDLAKIIINKERDYFIGINNR